MLGKKFIILIFIVLQYFIDMSHASTISVGTFDELINESRLIARVFIKEATYKKNKTSALNCDYIYTAEVREKVKGDVIQVKFVSNGQLKVGGEYLIFFESLNSAIAKNCAKNNIAYIATVYPEKILPIDQLASGFYGRDMLSQNLPWEGIPDSVHTVLSHKKSSIDPELDEDNLLIPYSELIAYIKTKVNR